MDFQPVSFASDNYFDVEYFSNWLPSLISPALSVIATFLAVLTCVISKFYREPLGFMVFAINLSDFLFCFCKLSVLAIQPTSDTYCHILQAVSYTSLLSSSIWGALFGHALLISSKYQSTLIIKRVIHVYSFCATMIPLFMGTATAFTDYVIYSDKVQSCVHRIYIGEFDYTFLIFGTIPVGGTCLFSLVWYVLAAFHLKKLIAKEQLGKVLTLFIYPGIFLVCWMPIVVKNVLVPWGIKPSPTVTIILREVAQLHGLLDALVYGGGLRNLGKSLKQCCLGKASAKSLRASGVEIDHSLATTEGLLTSSGRVDVGFSVNDSDKESNGRTETREYVFLHDRE